MLLDSALCPPRATTGLKRGSQPSLTHLQRAQVSQAYGNGCYNLLILGDTNRPFHRLPRFRFLLNGHRLQRRKKTPKQDDSQDQQSHGSKKDGHSDYK
jgi:hypothetical protein